MSHLLDLFLLDNLSKYIYKKHFLFKEQENIEIEISANLQYETYLLVLNHDASQYMTLTGILFGSINTYRNVMSIIHKGEYITVTQGDKNIPLKIIVRTNQISLKLIPLGFAGTEVNITAKGF